MFFCILFTPFFLFLFLCPLPAPWPVMVMEERVSVVGFGDRIGWEAERSRAEQTDSIFAWHGRALHSMIQHRKTERKSI